MSINYIYIVGVNSIIHTNNNNKNWIHHHPFEWNFVLFSLIVFLFVPIILLDSVNIAYSQNMSSSSSLKANAGEDQYVEEGQPVILNAEDSVSSRPPIDAFKWFQIEPRSPLIDLENSNTSRASFTSPNLPNDGYFIFQLVVKDQNITDTDTVNIYVVEDLASKSKELPGGGGYQPEQCFDGADNDLDGKIDLQDEECGMSSMQQFPNQVPLPPQSGGIPFNPNIPDGRSGQFPPQQGQPGQTSPEQGQPGQLSPGQPSPEQGQ
jgi:hypothetical protein